MKIFKSITRYLLIGVAFIALSAQAIAQSDTLWTRTYGGEHGTAANDMIITDDGYYVLAGLMQSNTLIDAYIVKTDCEGGTIWTSLFGGETYHTITSIHQYNDLYAASGYTQVSAEAEDDAWLVNISLDGDSLRGETYGGELYDGAQSWAIGNDNVFCFGGIVRVLWQR